MNYNIMTYFKGFLVDYIFGSEMLFALALVFVLFILLLAARVNPLWSFTIIVPLFVSLVGAGYFGAALWVKSAIMVILAIIWAFVLWKIMGD